MAWHMGASFGRVLPRHGKGRKGAARTGWVIDFGPPVIPRYLTSARGARFESEAMSQAVLDAIRVAIARGKSPQAAVDEFAPVDVERNGFGYWAAQYVAA